MPPGDDNDGNTALFREMAHYAVATRAALGAEPDEPVTARIKKMLTEIGK